MNSLSTDLSRYSDSISDQEAFEVLVESAQEAIAEETERLYLALYDLEKPLTESACQAIRAFAYKKAFFCVIRDRQEEIMNHEYLDFIRVMQREFEQRAKASGMTPEEYEDLTLDEECVSE